MNENSHATSRTQNTPIKARFSTSPHHGNNPNVDNNKSTNKVGKKIIENPITSKKCIYAKFDPDKEFITDIFADATGKNTIINLDSVIEFIINDQISTHKTIFENIYKIPPGSSLIKFHNSENVRFNNNIRPTNNSRDDIFKILCEVINNYVAEHDADTINIEFSGGCDSTGIALAARKNKEVKVVAYTWHDESGDSSEDVCRSSEIARILKIEHRIIKINPNELFEVNLNSPVYPIPETTIAFDQFSRRFRSEMNGRNSIILNGHGGDQVFAALPPASSAFSKRNIFNPTLFLSTFHHFKKLHGKNPIHTALSENIRNLKKIAHSSEYFKTTIRNHNKKANNLTWHQSDIHQAIAQNSLCDRNLALHPYTSPEMISRMWGVGVQEIIGNKGSRQAFRESIDREINGAFKLRIDKGHVTSAFQKAIKNKQAKLIYLISNGVLSSSKILHIDNTIKNLKACALGINGVDSKLMKIICFELMHNIIQMRKNSN